MFYILVVIVLSASIYLLIKAREKQLRSDRENLENQLKAGKEEM